MREMSPKAQLATRCIFLLAFAAALAGLTIIFIKLANDSRPIAFNAAVWRAPQTQLGLRRQRARMVTDLTRNRIKKGMTMTRILPLLGLPDQVASLGADSPNGISGEAYSYAMPDPLYGFRKLRYLTLRFNLQGRVTSIEVWDQRSGDLIEQQ